MGRAFVQCIPRKEIISKFCFILNNIRADINNEVVENAEKSVVIKYN